MPSFKSSKSSKHPIFVQHLLYPQPSSQSTSNAAPTYSSTHYSAANPMPIPVLINELFDICSSALHKLGKTKPGSEHSSSLMVQRKARLWGANISLFKIQYSEVKYGVSAEELMKRGDHGQLYAGMFRILAESIFHAYKVVQCIKDATNFKTSSNSTLWAWQHIQQDDALHSDLHRAMGLIRAHGAYFGFCFEGRDRWIERKSEEDYSVLYYDEGQKDKLFVAMEQAVRGDSEKWARKMSELDGEFARLRLRNGDLGPGPKENVVEKTKEGYEIKERWY